MVGYKFFMDIVVLLVEGVVKLVELVFIDGNFVGGVIVFIENLYFVIV